MKGGGGAGNAPPFPFLRGGLRSLLPSSKRAQLTFPSERRHFEGVGILSSPLSSPITAHERAVMLKGGGMKGARFFYYFPSFILFFECKKPPPISYQVGIDAGGLVLYIIPSAPLVPTLLLLPAGL